MAVPESNTSSFEILLPRLGEYMLAEGLISSQSLQEGLDFQKEKQLQGQSILLGQSLVSLGFISPEILDQVITKQIFDLHEALKTSNQKLEERVRERTLDLQQRLVQIRTAADITQAAIATDRPNELLKRTVELIVDRFEYYSASIFLLDREGENAVLAEMAGPFSESVKEVGQSIKVGSRSMVGWVAAYNKPRISGNLREEFFYRIDDLLTESRSEASLPIAVKKFSEPDRKTDSRFAYGSDQSDRTQVIGVLDVQHNELDAFDADAVAVLQIIANHIASVLQNVNLLKSTQSHLWKITQIYDAADDLSSSKTASEVFTVISRTIKELSKVVMLLIAHDNEFWRFESGQIALPGDNEEIVYEGGKLSRTRILRSEVDSAIQEDEFLVIDSSKPTTYPQILVSVCSLLDRRVIGLLPLKASGNLLGIILLGDIPDSLSSEMELNSSNHSSYWSATGGDYAPRMNQFLMLGRLTGAALERVTAHQSFEKRMRVVETVNSVNNFIASQTDLTGLFERIYHEIKRFMGEVDLQVAVYKISGRIPSIVYSVENGRETSGEEEDGQIFKSDQHPLFNVLKSKMPLVLNKDRSEKIQGVETDQEGRDIKSWMGIPMVFLGETVGALVLKDYETAGRFLVQDQSLLSILAGQLAMLIRNAYLLENTSVLADKDRKLMDITSKIRSTNDMQAIIEIAAVEIRKTLNLSRTRIDIDVETALPSTTLNTRTTDKVNFG